MKKITEKDGVLKVPAGYDRPIFQGDVCLVRVASVPDGATKTDNNVIAHSETMHDHVAENAIVFTTADASRLFLKALGKKPVKIVHKRDFDTHKTIQLPAGSTWEIRRQREHTPEGWRIVVD